MIQLWITELSCIETKRLSSAADRRLLLAIIRPIAAFDGEALVKSFDKWEDDSLGSICLGTDSYTMST